MLKMPVVLASGVWLDEPALLQRIEDSVAACGLQVTLKTTLAAHRGCVHWHLKKPRTLRAGYEKGTLELTAWAHQHALWFAVHDNRKGAWQDAAMLYIMSYLNLMD